MVVAPSPEVALTTPRQRPRGCSRLASMRVRSTRKVSKSREPWVVRLRYAYADTLESAGRETEALAWFHRTHAVDSQDLTDAADRAEVLEKRLD